jgi:hypothetical protein
VNRDGEWKQTEVRELVPGDLIELKGGDVVPADAVVRFWNPGVTVNPSLPKMESSNRPHTKISKLCPPIIFVCAARGRRRASEGGRVIPDWGIFASL